MSPFRFELGRPAHLSSKPICDLTNKIIRLDNQYCEAGASGDIFRCWYMSDGGAKEVAVKAFRFSFLVDDSEHMRDRGKVARLIRRELGIWSRLSHRNIVPFLGIAHGFGKQGSASLVSIWMPHGTLHTFLEAYENQLAVSHRLQLLLDIANGLHYLHSFPMVHGDLSSNNVLLDHNYNACLTDFGCASLIGELPEGFTYLKTTTVRPGTLRWAAPEHFSLNEEDSRHTIKSDIYSFGNMAHLVLSGKYPWSEVRADVAVILRLSRGLKPGRPDTRPIDDQHWTLVQRCWLSVPERPLAEDIVCSLEQLLGACAPLPPLRELPSIRSPPPSLPDHLGDSSHRAPPYAVVREHTNALHLPSGETMMPDRERHAGGTISSWVHASSQVLIHPFLNGETPRMDFSFDLAHSIFSPFRLVRLGQLSAVSADELQEPATYPPVARMRISHDTIPHWPIDLEFRGDGDATPTVPHPITFGDVLFAVHSSLHKQVTSQEWAKLSLPEEAEIMRAYAWRCRDVLSSGQVESEGARRIDYLREKHVFRGLIKAQGEEGLYHWRLITG